jgi:hypothetical protein
MIEEVASLRVRVINIRLSNGANCDYFYFEECE